MYVVDLGRIWLQSMSASTRNKNARAGDAVPSLFLHLVPTDDEDEDNAVGSLPQDQNVSGKLNGRPAFEDPLCLPRKLGIRPSACSLDQLTLPGCDLKELEQ